MVAFLVATVVIAAIGAALLAGGKGAPASISLDFESVSGVSLGVVAVVIATRLMFFTEKGLSWSSLRLDRAALAPRHIAFGLTAGALGIGIPSGLLLLAHEIGVLNAPSGNWIQAAAFDVVFFALAAAIEELVVRGYIFSLLRRRWGWKTALICTSIAFGALHLANPGVNFESVLNVILAGIFLGGILLVTRSLYAAIAAHFAWNWTMAALFHSAVSGATIPAPNYATVDNGPDWLTGGMWGPEGGAAATAALVILIFFLHKRRARQAET